MMSLWHNKDKETKEIGERLGEKFKDTKYKSDAFGLKTQVEDLEGRIEDLEEKITALSGQIDTLIDVFKHYKKEEIKEYKDQIREQNKFMQDLMFQVLELSIKKAEEKKTPSVSPAVQTYLDKKQNGKGLPLP